MGDQLAELSLEGRGRRGDTTAARPEGGDVKSFPLSNGAVGEAGAMMMLAGRWRRRRRRQVAVARPRERHQQRRRRRRNIGRLATARLASSCNREHANPNGPVPNTFLLAQFGRAKGGRLLPSFLLSSLSSPSSPLSFFLSFLAS